MLPTIRGDIVNRVLINYRADAGVVGTLLPPAFELDLQNGAAVVGVCVIELAHLRPVGMPEWSGLSSVNAAHRVAVRFRTDTGWRTGVYIWRRDSNSRLTTLLGGRLFPGVHGSADVRIDSQDSAIQIDVQTSKHDADVSLQGRSEQELTGSQLFANLNEASDFFRRGDCGYSCSHSGGEFEGMRLNTEAWNMRPVTAESVKAMFYDDTERFPSGSIAFDCALLMTHVPHRWEALASMPNAAEPVSSRASH